MTEERSAALRLAADRLAITLLLTVPGYGLLGWYGAALGIIGAALLLPDNRTEV